jgi:chitodextrinase
MKNRFFRFSCMLLAAAIILLNVPMGAKAAISKIADFENGTTEGWDEGARLVGGYNSQYSLRITNSANNSAGSRKDFNYPILRGFEKIEFDLHLHGTQILPGDASALVFEQGGWKWVSIYDYVKNGHNDWQHVAIPLNAFNGLNTNEGIAYSIFRFWNNRDGNYDIDNITLTNSSSTISAPTNLTGSAISATQINLNWNGNTPIYNVYRNSQKIASTNQTSFAISNLTPDTNYNFYITGTNGSQESAGSNTISVRTLTEEGEKKLIADFENGTTQGWDEGAQLAGGLNSQYALKISNPAYGSAATRRYFNGSIAQGYEKMEFDLNLNGSSLLNGDAAAVVFEQGGWKMASLNKYAVSGLQGWQHVAIPLSEIAGFNANSGVAYILIRFWNEKPGMYLIDNISFTKGSSGPIIVPKVPTNLSGAAPASNRVQLTWSGEGPNYRIYRDGSAIATTSQTAYTDNNVFPSTTYRYSVLAFNDKAESSQTSQVAVTTPATQSTFPFKSIDSQIASKYWTMDANQIRHLVQANKSLGARYIAISTNYDNTDKMQMWADAIHAEGMNVWFRGHWNDWDSWEKPEIKNGITSGQYLNRTHQFILDHPSLFRAGDSFTMCVEAENAAWWTGIDNGPFRGWNDYKSFLRNEVSMSNDAFNRIGYGGKIYTNWLNMNGWVAWNILDQETVNAIGQLTLDHIIDWTEDIPTYVDSLFHGKTFGNGDRYYGYDEYYNKYKVPIMAGEWGHSTFNQNMSPEAQRNMVAAVMDEFSKRSYIVGVNYWVDAGHASRLFDSPNLLDYYPRPVAEVIARYYR